MYLNDLPDVLRRAGLSVEVCSDYMTNVHGPMTAVKTIVTHHTAGPATGDRPSLNVVRNGRPGLDGPLSQLFLARSGTWIVVSAGLCWHAGVVSNSNFDNYHAIGVEAEATGVSPWPAVQYDSYVRGVRALRDYYRAAVMGHKEIAFPLGRKSDPNFDMNRFRSDVETAGSVPVPIFPDEVSDMNVVIHFYNDDWEPDPAGLNFRALADVEHAPSSAVVADSYVRWGSRWAPQGKPGVTGWRIVFWDYTRPLNEVDFSKTSDYWRVPDAARSVTFEGRRANPGVIVSARLLEKGI